MRLKPTEITTLIEVIKDATAQSPGKLFLYGSRVDDHQKGGDIDLVWVAQNPEDLKKCVKPKHHITALLKKKLGDRKIDFSAIHSLKTQEPFWQVALQTCQLLYEHQN